MGLLRYEARIVMTGETPSVSASMTIKGVLYRSELIRKTGQVAEASGMGTPRFDSDGGGVLKMLGSYC